MPAKHELYFVYIVECSDKTYYIGKTFDLDKRLNQHNGLLPGGAKYTASRKPVKLVYMEMFREQTLALKREWQMKQLTRQQKEALIGEDL